MILVSVAVKTNRGDLLGLCPLGQGNADCLGSPDVAAGLDLAAQLLVARAGRTERNAGGVVDDLGVNIPQAAKDRKARPFGGSADSLLQAHLAPIASVGFNFDRLHMLTL